MKNSRIGRSVAVLAVAALAVAVVSPAFSAAPLTKGKVKKIVKKEINKRVPNMITDLGGQQFASLSNFDKFSVVLDANNAEQTIGTHGPLRLFARCLINDAGQDRVQILADSTVAPWFHDDSSTPQAANTPFLASTTSGATGTTVFTNNIDGFATAVKDGTTIRSLAFQQDATAMGVNVFGHRCYTSGVIFKTTVTG
jgi:hypothetical protein